MKTTFNENGSRLKEYTAWCSIKARCYNPKNKRYPRYGARGIKLCDEWLNNFNKFLSDVGKAPTAKHSIDRIDNNGHYEPKNVRWATYTQQARNRSNNNIITLDNITMTLQEWSQKYGISQSVVLGRIKRGWAISDALTKPAIRNPNSKPRRELAFNGTTKTIAEWSRHTGIKRSTIEMRLRYGWSIEDTLSVKK